MTMPPADRPSPPPRVASCRSPPRPPSIPRRSPPRPLIWPDPDLLFGQRRGSSPSPRLADLLRQRDAVAASSASTATAADPYPRRRPAAAER